MKKLLQTTIIIYTYHIGVVIIGLPDFIFHLIEKEPTTQQRINMRHEYI
ncbi:hypothetical protein [Flavobacterium sp.]|nr:hypothetical protein [Flavobacterium sp.]HLF53535.1 hypothetical protein [Flavobacterium sp.]